MRQGSPLTVSGQKADHHIAVMYMEGIDRDSRAIDRDSRGIVRDSRGIVRDSRVCVALMLN